MFRSFRWFPSSETVKVSGGTAKKKSTTEGTENTEASTYCNSVVFSVSSVPSVVKSRGLLGS